MYENKLFLGNSIEVMQSISSNSIDCIISDIPYGIGYEDWDILHDNKNSALLGQSPAQKKSNTSFKSRGKPLNGWSADDKNIGKEYYDWCLTWTKTCLNIVKPCSSVFIFAGRRYCHKVIDAMEDSGFIFKDMIAWEKDCASYKSQQVSKVFERREDDVLAKKWHGWRLGNLRPVFEPILWFMKPYPIGTTIADNVIKYNLGCFNDAVWNRVAKNSSNLIRVKPHGLDLERLHPTQKPLNLIMLLIRLVTIPQQVVLDPFMGSGTTCLGAYFLKRKYIGIEQNKQFFEKAKKRIKDQKGLLS